jgi:hypothetical protein
MLNVAPQMPNQMILTNVSYEKKERKDLQHMDILNMFSLAFHMVSVISLEFDEVDWVNHVRFCCILLR